MTTEVVNSECEDMFVETKAFHEIVKILHKQHYVIIKGNTGDGKTTLAHFALRTLIVKHKKPFQLFNSSDWDTFISPNANLAILIDNAFDVRSDSGVEVNEWINRIQEMKAAVGGGQRSNYLIFTTHNNNIPYQRKKKSLSDFMNTATVDISNGQTFELSYEEMEKIFIKYMPKDSLSRLSQSQLSNLLRNSPKIGFPQCCRYFQSNSKLQTLGFNFFQDPLNCLKEEIKYRLDSKDMAMAVLIYILLHGGKVEYDTLCDCETDIELKKTAIDMCLVDCGIVQALIPFRDAIDSIEKTFIVHDTNTETVKFAHSSIQSAVFVVVGKYKTHDLIKYCDYTLLSIVTTSKSVINDIECVQISDSCLDILISRIYALLSNSTLYPRRLLKVISELYVWEDIRVLSKCMCASKLFAAPVDKDGNSLFVHFSAAGNMLWVTKLYDDISDKSQLTLALEAVSGKNRLHILKFLLKKEVKPNIKCCFNAVRGGHADVLKALAKANVDFTELCGTQSYWKILPISTTIIDEAALLNQCGLIGTLLELCPQLVNVKSSNDTTFLHSIARAGNNELLKKYIACKSFSVYDKSGFNSTILHFACQSNRWDTVRYIVETYPDLLLPTNYCCEDGTVLHTAAQGGSLKIFQYVFMETKAKLKKEKITSIQLDNDCFVYGTDSTKQNCIGISQLLQVRDKTNRSILHQAAWSRSIELFEHIASTDYIGLDAINEIGSILGYANTRNDNEDMLLFLKKKYQV